MDFIREYLDWPTNQPTKISSSKIYRITENARVTGLCVCKSCFISYFSDDSMRQTAYEFVKHLFRAGVHSTNLMAVQKIWVIPKGQNDIFLTIQSVNLSRKQAKSTTF